jgi:hypothetical protein
MAGPVLFGPLDRSQCGRPRNGYGPRVAESGLGLITGLAYSGPYEDVRLKAR